MAYHVLRSGAAAASNPSLILNPRNPSYSKDNQPLSIEIDGVKYMRAKALAKKGDRKEPSVCWSYGERLIQSSDKKKFYYCYDCEDDKLTQQLVTADGTTNPRSHMKTWHSRDPDTGVAAVKPKKDQDKVISFVKTESLKEFKRLLVRWFVVCQLAFFMLENTVFRELIAFMSSGVAKHLPKASATLRKWIMEAYDDKKIALKEEISKSISRIHISFDIWTAGNWIGVISVWGYWVNAAGERQRRLLAFRRIYRSHSGDNQAAIILDILEEYEISFKVGYFVCDNASSNDAAVAIILRTLDPTISTAELTARRLRCFGHILNLSARSLLDPSGSEFVVAAEELEIDESTLERDASTWQSTGSLGKLHKLVKYILASPQRREEFGEIKGGRKVVEFDHLGVSCYFVVLRKLRTVED
jgi:hypothetical protein